MEASLSPDARFASGQPPREVLLELEEVREKIEEQLTQAHGAVAATIAVSTGLSVGYVLWLVRGGLLLSSVLSALPAWQLIDPLPVLGSLKRTQDDSDPDDDAIEGLFQRSRTEPRPAAATTVLRARHVISSEAGA
jgi:hypothetical protein